MKPIRSHNNFVKNYVLPNEKVLRYILDNEKTFHINEGPIRAGKTSDNIVKFCEFVENSPDPIHLAVAQTQPTAKAILFEHEGFGIAHYPDWQQRTEIVDGKKITFRQRIFYGQYNGYDALILLPKKGSNHPIKYIVAFGGSKEDSHESYKGWGVGTFIATQWELLHANTRNELLKRTALSKYRKHVMDLNPVSPNHEIYKDMDRWIANGDVNFLHKTMKDNPVMTDDRIQSIISEYDPESIDFQRDILGKRVAAEGLIYRVRDYNIIDSFNPNDYFTYVISADTGINHSATTFILLAITKDRKYLDVLNYYWHKNSEHSNLAIKMPSDYVEDFQDFIKSSINLMKKPPLAVLSDIDLTFIREFERTKYKSGLGAITLESKFKKDEIHDRIKTGINLLWKGRLRFYSKCDKVIEAYKSARYDEKQRDKGNYVRYDNPSEGTMIDPIDAVEYAITRTRHEWNVWKG